MKKRFKIGNDIFEIPDSEVSSFLKENPSAQEVKLFDIEDKSTGKKTQYNIPINEVDEFVAEMGLPSEKKNAVGKNLSNGMANLGQYSSHSTPLTGTILSSTNSPEVSENPYAKEIEKGYGIKIFEVANKVYPDKADKIYHQVVEAIDSKDNDKLSEANDLLKKMSILNATNDSALTNQDKSEIKRITGTDDPKLQLSKLADISEKASRTRFTSTDVLDNRTQSTNRKPNESVDTALSEEDLAKVSTYFNKLNSVLNTEVNDKWVNKDIKVEGGKDTTELEDIMKTLGGLGGLSAVTIGQKITGSGKRTNDQNINLSLSTGIEYLKNTDPARYKRITNDITDGKRLASSDVVELTTIGAKIVQSKNVQDLWDENTSIQDFSDRQVAYNKDMEDNVYKNPDYLRTLIADVVGKHYEQDGGVPFTVGGIQASIPRPVFSKWMVTDKEMDAIPESEWVAAGLDPNNPEFKKQLKFIKERESWIPFINAISKDDLFREFKKGAMSVPQGLGSTLESINPFVSNEQLELDKRTEGNSVANVANQRGQWFNDHYGKWADAFNGFGQFATQLALMFAGSGGVGATGEALGGGTTSSYLLNATKLERAGNLLLKNKDLYGTYGTSFIMTYGDYYKDALSKGADPLTAKMMAFTNASMEGISETIFDNIEFGKKLAKDFTRKENYERIAKIFDKGVLDDASQKAFRENLQTTIAKTIGEGALGLGKEAFEEVPVAMTNFIVDAAINPANVHGRDIIGESKDAFLNGLVSFSIPSILGLAGGFNKQSNSLDRTQPESLMISTLQAPYVIDAINRLKDSGELSQEEADKKIQVINTAAHQFSIMPQTKRDEKGQAVPMTWEDREDYLSLSVKQKYLEQKIKDNNDEASATEYKQQITDILDEKKKILGIKTATDEKKVQSVPAPATEKGKTQVKTGEETLIQKIRNEVSKPKNDTEDERLRVESFIKAPDKDFEDVIDQSVDAPARTLEVLNNNKELLTDAISQKSEDEINKSIASWQQRTKNLPDNASDEEITAVMKDVKDNLALLREGLAKKQAAVDNNPPKQELTQEAKDYLSALDKKAGGIPMLTPRLEKIAADNGIKVKGNTTAQDIVNQLREKSGVKQKVESKQAEIKFDQVAESVPEENKKDFTQHVGEISSINEKLKTENDPKVVADLMNQRNELYKKVRGSLGKVEKPNAKVRVSSNLLEIANDFGVSVEDAAEIDKISEESETPEEYSTRLNEFLANRPQLEVSEGQPTVKNINLGGQMYDQETGQMVESRGRGFEKVMDATKHFEMEELSAFNEPLETRLNKAFVDMQKDGRVKWYWTTEDQRSDKLGLEMFDDPNGREITRRETLYDILTGEGYSERQRGMAAAYIIANRLVSPYGSRDNLHNFNSRLFDKAGGKVIIFYSEKKDSQLLAAGPDGTIAINAAKMGSRLSEYIRNGGGEKTFLTWAEVALNEEVLHLATFKVATKAELEQIHDEMSPQEREVVSNIYESTFKNEKGEVNKSAIAGEYIRMVMQERILGRFANENRTGTITEMFKPGMEKSKPAPGQKIGLRTFFAKLTAWMTKVFKDTKSKKAKEVIQRLNDYISGKPLQAEVVTEAVVKQPNVMAIQYAGKEQFIENRGGAYHLVERDKDGKFVDAVDPLKGSSLLGFSIGEAQDAIKMSSDMLGASQGARGESFIENISKRIGASDLEQIFETLKDKISTNSDEELNSLTAELVALQKKQLSKDASDKAINNILQQLFNTQGKDFVETLRDLNYINNDEAEVLNSQAIFSAAYATEFDTESLLISQLGFQLNASQGMDDKARKLWEQKQREKLDKQTAKVAKDINDGKTTYQDAVAGQTDEYIESLAAQVNPTLHNDEFRNYVRRLRDAGYTSQQVKDDLSIRKRVTKAESDIIDDEYQNTYENDPAIKALRESLTELQEGRRPKSVLKTLLNSRISDIVKTLKDFAYDKVSNKELESMVDQILSNIDLKNAEKFIATMDGAGLSDLKQLFRAKVVIALRNQNFAGAKAMSKRLVSDMATDATVAGRQTQSLRRAYELFHAYGSPEMKSNFARQYAASVSKKAEEKIGTVLKDVKKYKEETEKLNDEIHQEAIDKILESELQKNKLQEELDKICNARTRKRK